MTQLTKSLGWNEATREYEWTGSVTGLVKAVGFGDARLGFVLDKKSGARIAMNLSGSDDPQATDPFYIESPNQENIYDASNMREAIKILTNIRKGKRDPDLNPTSRLPRKTSDEIAGEMAIGYYRPFEAFGKQWQGDIFFSDIYLRTKKHKAADTQRVADILRSKGYYVHTNPTGGIGMKNPSIVDAIRPGDKVTIVNRFGQKSTGRAVMRSSHGGWVLNMGGRYGTPGLADADNIVKVVPSKKPTTFGMTRLMHNPKEHWDMGSRFYNIGRKYPHLSVPEKHQLRIAYDTLRMSDDMVGIMGGPNKAEAREIIKRLTGKDPVGNPTKEFLAFTHAGTQYKVSIRPETMGHVVQYGSHKFPLPHPSWKIIGFSTHHWHRSPTISMEQAAKDPSIIKGAYVWDIDHGTTRTWGGQHYGKLPKVQSASLRNPTKTPVMFRKWPNGDIIALFPTDPGTMDPYTCSSYEHVGQHGAADPHGVIRMTKPAKPSEYADLKMELHGIGYRNMVVYDRYQPVWLEIRRKLIKEGS